MVTETDMTYFLIEPLSNQLGIIVKSVMTAKNLAVND